MPCLASGQNGRERHSLDRLHQVQRFDYGQNCGPALILATNMTPDQFTQAIEALGWKQSDFCRKAGLDKNTPAVG